MRLNYRSFSDTPLEGGLVYFYEPGTLVAKTVYANPDLTAPFTNPVTLNGIGDTVIYGAGTYRVRVTDKDGSLILDLPELQIPPGVGIPEWTSIIAATGYFSESPLCKVGSRLFRYVGTNALTNPVASGNAQWVELSSGSGTNQIELWSADKASNGVFGGSNPFCSYQSHTFFLLGDANRVPSTSGQGDWADMNSILSTLQPEADSEDAVLVGADVDLVVDSLVRNYNVANAVGSVTGPVSVTLTVNAPIYSIDNASYAFTTGGLPAGSKVTIFFNVGGYILGAKGNGQQRFLRQPLFGRGGPAVFVDPGVELEIASTSVASTIRAGGGAGGPAISLTSHYIEGGDALNLYNGNLVRGGDGAGASDVGTLEVAETGLTSSISGVVSGAGGDIATSGEYGDAYNVADVIKVENFESGENIGGPAGHAVRLGDEKSVFNNLAVSTVIVTGQIGT